LCSINEIYFKPGQQKTLSEIIGCNCGDYEDYCLVTHDAMQFGRNLSMYKLSPDEDSMFLHNVGNFTEHIQARQIIVEVN
jgi:hypothetical protein